MIYFDIRPAIERLSFAERGELFTAILDYGGSGERPHLDGMAGMAFDFIAPKIERDAQSYKEKQLQKKYAVYCRETKKDGIAPASFEEWLFADNRLISHDIE